MKPYNEEKLRDIIENEIMCRCFNLCNPSCSIGDKNMVFSYPDRFRDIIDNFTHKIYFPIKILINNMADLPIEELEMLTKQYMKCEPKKEENNAKRTT